MALNAFGFITHVDHPHKFVLNYLQLLGLNDKALLQEAWSLSNDRWGQGHWLRCWPII